MTVDEYSIKARQVQFKQGLCQAVTTAVSKKHFHTPYNTVLIITVCVKVANSTFLVTNKSTKWAEL